MKLVKSLAAVLLAIAGSAQAQVVTTVAGTGWIIPKLNMPGPEAPLGLVRAMRPDRDGNLLVLDALNHIVFRVSADGTFTSVAGNGLAGPAGDGGPATRAALDFPEAITADPSGNIYIADSGGARVRRVDPDGIISTVAGGGTSSISNGAIATQVRFSDIESMAVLPGGDLLVVDQSLNRIIRIDASGTLSLFAGNGSFECGAGLDGPATESALCDPSELLVDPAGNLYFLDKTSLVSGGKAVRKISPDGIITSYAGNGQLGQPVDGAPALETPIEAVSLAFDREGRLLIMSGFIGTGSGRRTTIVRVNEGVAEIVRAQGLSEFIPLTIGVLPDHSIVFGTFQPSRISRIRADGVIEKFAGTERFGYSGDGGPAILAQFNAPTGIEVGPDGNLYITDTANGRVRRMTRQGVVTTIAGNGEFVFDVDLEQITAVPAVLAPMLLPTGITFGADGNLYYFSSFGLHQLGTDGIQYTASYGTQAPGFITFDTQRRLILIDTMRHIAIRINAAGAELFSGTGFGQSTGDGGLARNASLANPTGVLGVPDGSVLIAETNGHRIRRVAPSGIISTWAGNGEATGTMPSERVRASETSITAPSGLALDRAGNVLVRSNGYISRITPSGELTVIAGVGPKGVIYGDGGPASRAALSPGGGLAVDTDGGIFFTEPNYNRIRKILATAPSFSASPSSLDFSGASGGAPPRPQTITVIGGVPSLGFTVRVRTASGGNWLTADASEAAAPRLLRITANPASLAAGTYTGTVELEAPFGSPRTITINVRFTVGASLPANLQVDQSALSFTYPRTARRRGQLLVLSNSGSGSISYEAAASNGSYLVITPARGTVTAGSPLALRVEAEPGTRRSGTYRDTINIRWTGAARTVSTVMTISDREQGILLSQAGLSFQAVAQGGIVPPQSFRVINTGNGSMAWRATASTLAGGPGWLRVAPANGVSQAGQTAPAVEVRIAQEGLAPGVYYGLVQVESIGAANTPHVLTVSLEVLPAGSRPGSVVQPRELSFQVTEGQSASSDDLTVYNLTGSPVTFRSSAPPLGPDSQILYAPIDARVAPNDPQRIVVQPNTAALPAGSHRGSIALQFDDGTVRQVDVNIVVTPRGLSQSTKIDPRRGADGCTPKALVPSIRSIGQAASVPAGWPTAVVAELRDDCGRAVDDGAVTMSFSNGDPPVALQSVRDGVWHGTWAPRSASTGTVTIRMQAEDRVLNLRGEREIAADLRAGQDPPEVLSGGVVNTPSPTVTAPVSPGGLITVNGARITVNQTLSAPPRQNLPTRLQDTEIIVGGRRLPLFAASVDKAEAMLPFDLTPNTSHQVLVRRGLTYSKPIAIDVAPAQPSVLLNTQAGGGQALAEVRRPGANAFLNTPANTARPGDTIAIFCTGLGPVTAALEAGQLTPQGAALRVAAAVRARIGGVEAQVAQASLVEGEIGRYQVVVTIPAPVTPGDRVPVEIEAEGLTSAPATLAIRAQ